MTEFALKVISDGMEALELAYGFLTYSGNPVVYPYFVGEYTESEPTTEDGLEETVFLLTGFSRTSGLALERAKGKIKKHFNKDYGKTVIAEDGSAVTIFYANAIPVPTGDAELKRMQINLRVKEWTVN